MVGLVVISTVVAFGQTAASAHAQLESTDPSQSSVLVEAPRQVVLHFGEPVEIDFGSIRVYGPGDKRVDEGGTHHPAGDSHAVAIALPSHMPDGTYVVAWRVISADSHPVHGAFVFSVGSARGAGTANSLASALNNARGSTAVGIVFGALRFGLFAGLLVVVGLGAMVALVWKEAGSAPRIRRTLWWSWAAVLACSLGGIAVQGVYAASLPLTHLFNVSLINEVLHNRFGEVEVIRILLLLAGVPILVALGRAPNHDRRRRRWVLPGAAVSLGLLLTPGLAGHAATGGDPVLGLALDVAHLGSAALWIGGLVMLAALLVPGMAQDERPMDAIELARRFSPYAFGAVVVVVASGVVQSLRQVGSFYALFHTAYGRILIVKVCFVTVLVGLGAISRRFVIGRWRPTLARRPETPWPDGVSPPGEMATADRLENEEGVGAGVAVATMARRTSETEPIHQRRGGLRRSIVAEVVMMAAVLVATSLLVNAPPAKQAAAQPFSQTFNVLGVQVNAIVDPARVGPDNRFHFYVLGRMGQPVGIPELDASISLPAQDIGPITLPVVVAGPGHYRASGVDVPVAGSWVLKVTVRTSAIDEQEVFATVSVH